MEKKFDAEISEKQVKELDNFLEQVDPEELEKIAGGFSAAGAAAALSGRAKMMADKLIGSLSERSKQILRRLGLGAAAVVSLYLLYRTLPKKGASLNKDDFSERESVNPAEAFGKIVNLNGGLTDEQLERFNDMPADQSDWTFGDVRWCLYGKKD